MSFLLCTGGQKSDNWWTCLTITLVSELLMSSLICGHLKFLPPRAEPLRARSMGLCLVGHHPILSSVAVPTVQARTRPLSSCARALHASPLGGSVARWLRTYKCLSRITEERMKLEKAQLVVQGLKEAGVDFTDGVPDAQFTEVYKMLADDPDIRYVGTANEAEAVGVGFGAWFGGQKPALMIATSGLLVATYHLARINILHEVPLLVVIPYRGDIGDPRWLGLYKKTTEPGLNAMDIPYRIVSRPGDIVRTIKECNESARAWLKCIAVILNEEALW